MIRDIPISEVEAIRAIGSHLLRAKFYKAHGIIGDAEELLGFARRLNERLPADNKMTVPASVRELNIDLNWPIEAAKPKEPLPF